MRHDPGLRRKVTRAGRMTGCYIYIPAESIRRAGVEPREAKYYRTWSGARSGSVIVRLYDKP